MNVPISSEGSLYSKILSKEGITGLLLFMFATFLMTIIWQGQQKHHTLLTEIKTEELKQTTAENEQIEILEDIRYSLRQQGGLVLRDSAR